VRNDLDRIPPTTRLLGLLSCAADDGSPVLQALSLELTGLSAEGVAALKR
jgi:hypothetical protein